MSKTLAKRSKTVPNKVPSVDGSRRLLFSPACQKDIPELFGFLGDPDAMRHTHHDRDFNACRKRVLVHEWMRRRDGFAPWVVRSRQSDRIIGWGGLCTDPFDPGWGPELVYYFHPDVWGNGFARELARAAIDHARDATSIDVLTGFAHPGNVASRKLLLGCGFRHVGYVAKLNRDRFALIL
ncbi:GNAT family N-acetyltransferase [Thalassospira sp. MA62]|nr:GNAT family N-acetyltransferase [Thalassospira sp. MA62]